jgi:hypothetical protein
VNCWWTSNLLLHVSHPRSTAESSFR